MSETSSESIQTPSPAIDTISLVNGRRFDVPPSAANLPHTDIVVPPSAANLSHPRSGWAITIPRYVYNQLKKIFKRMGILVTNIYIAIVAGMAGHRVCRVSPNAVESPSPDQPVVMITTTHSTVESPSPDRPALIITTADSTVESPSPDQPAVMTTTADSTVEPPSPDQPAVITTTADLAVESPSPDQPAVMITIADSTMESPSPDQPAVMIPTNDSILLDAEGTDATFAIISSVQGDLIIDPAAIPAAGFLPSATQGRTGNHQFDILRGAKRTNLQCASITTVSGNQFGAQLPLGRNTQHQ